MMRVKDAKTLPNKESVLTVPCTNMPITARGPAACVVSKLLFSLSSVCILVTAHYKLKYSFLIVSKIHFNSQKLFSYFSVSFGVYAKIVHIHYLVVPVQYIFGKVSTVTNQKDVLCLTSLSIIDT